MSTKQNKAIVQGYLTPPQGWKELNRQIQTAADPAALIEKESREVMDRYFSLDCVIHWSSLGNMSYQDYLQGNIDILTTTGDLSYTPEEMIAEGDKVMVRYTMRGVAKGPVMGFPATGKQMQVNGIMICKLAGGKIIEAWGMSDFFGMMQQIGAIPPLGQK